MRLDKLLAHSGYGTRKEVKELIRKGYVSVNGEVVKNDDAKVDEILDEVIVEGYMVDYRKFVYILLNKPAGVVSATFDNRDETVLDIVDEYSHLKMFPVGRLDKDTEGLLLICNDGELAHKLLSPKNHVEKEYYVEVSGTLTESDIVAFNDGVVLEDGYKCKSAKLEILSSSENSTCNVIISEGKFHQIKRMFEMLGKKVTYLKRIRFKNLLLDESLELGEYRELSIEELNDLRN